MNQRTPAMSTAVTPIRSVAPLAWNCEACGCDGTILHGPGYTLRQLNDAVTSAHKRAAKIQRRTCLAPFISIRMVRKP